MQSLWSGPENQDGSLFAFACEVAVQRGRPKERVKRTMKDRFPLAAGPHARPCEGTETGRAGKE